MPWRGPGGPLLHHNGHLVFPPADAIANVTSLVTGQVVSAEILMASEHGCPIEMHRIPIEKCDEMYDANCTGNVYMPFQRAGYDGSTGQSPNSPREQVIRDIATTK